MKSLLLLSDEHTIVTSGRKFLGEVRALLFERRFEKVFFARARISV